jgi:sugar phosphate permease
MCGIKDLTNASKADKCCICKITFAVCFLVSLSLIIGGFLMPPMGVIDGSVLTAVGELLLFPTLLYGYRAIELGYEVKIQHGETSVEIHNKEDGE